MPGRFRTRHLLAAVLAAAVLAALPGCGGGTGGGGTSSGAGAGTAGFPGASLLPAGLRGRPAPTFRLASARGGTLDTARLRGRPYAVTFLYVHCPDVCPLIAQELVTALRRIGPAASRVAVAAVSVDPEGDTPADVRAFLRAHRAPPQFAYGIGSRRELQPVWRAWFAAPQIPGRPESAHTATVWLIDRDGRIAAKYDGGTAIDPADLASAFRTLLRA